MAVTKKKTTTRRKAAVSGTPKKTLTIAGKRYTHKVCGSKTEMAKRATTHRAKGASKTARVVKNGTKYCLYTRG
jgi:hypothetical protein